MQNDSPNELDDPLILDPETDDHEPDVSTSPIAHHYSSEIVFPPINSDLGGKRTTLLRGKILNNGGDINIDDISHLLVNGMSTAWSLDENGNWLANIDVGINAKSIDVSTVYTDGTKHELHHPILNKPRFAKADFISYNTENDRLYAVDSTLKEVFSIDYQNQLIEILNAGENTSVEMFSSLSGFKVVPENNKAYFSDSYLKAIYSIDLRSGERELVSSESQGSGVNFKSPCDISVDSIHQKIYVLDCLLKSVVAVDILSGNRTIISSPEMNSETAFDAPVSIVYEPNTNRIIIGDSGLKALILIEVVSGARRFLSSKDFGVGPDIDHPFCLVFDAINNRIIVGNSTRYKGQGSIIAVDTYSGNRVTISDSSVGKGDKITLAKSITLDIDNKIIISDIESSVPIEVDPVTGDRTPLDDYVKPLSYDLTNAAVISTNDMFYVSSNNKIFSIDKSSRERRLISGNLIGNGDSFGWLKGIALDESTNSILAVDSDNKSIVRIDLLSGNRVTLSGPLVGGGDNLHVPYAIKLDLARHRALVLGNAPLSLTAVDLSSGDREIVFSSNYNSSDFSSSFALSEDGNYAYIPYSSELVIEVTLSTGLVNELFNTEDTKAGYAFIARSGNRLIVLDHYHNGRLVHFDLSTLDINIIADHNSDTGITYPVCNLILEEKTDILYSACGELIAIDAMTGKRVFY